MWKPYVCQVLLFGICSGWPISCRIQKWTLCEFLCSLDSCLTPLIIKTTRGSAFGNLQETAHTRQEVRPTAFGGQNSTAMAATHSGALGLRPKALEGLAVTYRWLLEAMNLFEYPRLRMLYHVIP